MAQELSLPDDAEELARVNDVPLYATDIYVIVAGPQGSIEWGTWQDHGDYRSLCGLYADLDPLATCGLYFELTWSVATYWLWRYTTDPAVSPETLDEVAALPYANDYGFDTETKHVVADAIYEYIDGNTDVQDRLIANRNARTADDRARTEIHRLSPARYTGTYTVTDVLFTDADRERFYEFVDDNDWDVDPDAYIDEQFAQAEAYDGPAIPIVTTDATPKPVMDFVDGIIATDPAYSQQLAKVVEVAPVRDDVTLDITCDYDTGDLQLTLTTET